MISTLVHLRLHFQLLLAPVFLCGWLAAGGGLSRSVGLAFVAMHAFLYTGATAFNSYYDRDQGPVGGLERPPPVEQVLLPVALALQVIGGLLAVLVNVSFAAVYVVFGVLSLAYSHPSVRLKARPLASLLTVAVGQGVLAFLGAWAATRGEIFSAVSVDGVLGALSATLLIVAVYPLTQLYQVDEDRARGDATMAVAWGAQACFALALGSLVVGGTALVCLVWRRFGALDSALIGCGVGAECVALARWARRYDASRTLANYRQVMRLNTLSAAGLGVYFLGRLLGR